jgi:hypothetical protein
LVGWLVHPHFFLGRCNPINLQRKKKKCPQEVEAKAFVETTVTCMVIKDTTRLSEETAGVTDAMWMNGAAKTLGHALSPLCDGDFATVQTTAFVAKHVLNATTRPAYCASRVIAEVNASVTHTVALTVRDKHVFFANRITGMAVQPSQENQSTGIPQHT